jgi:hypothetical protein
MLEGYPREDCLMDEPEAAKRRAAVLAAVDMLRIRIEQPELDMNAPLTAIAAVDFYDPADGKFELGWLQLGMTDVAQLLVQFIHDINGQGEVQILAAMREHIQAQPL